MTASRTRTALIIAGEFPPLKTIGRIRTVKFVEHLRNHGWESIVVTLAPNGREANYDASLLAEVPPGVEVIRVPLVTFDDRITAFAKRLLGRNRKTTTESGNHPNKGKTATQLQPRRRSAGERLQMAVKQLIRLCLDVPDNFLPWALAAMPEIRRLCKKRQIDLVFTTLPPFSAAYVGYKLAGETSIPWIADYRDLWYGDVLREWLPRWRQRLELVIEKRILKRASVVVTVSEQKTDYMRKLHPGIRARWATLTNGYDKEIYEERTRTRGFDEPVIEFVYTGRLFKNRRGYAFAEALGRIKRDTPALVAPVRVRILGGVSDEIAQRYEQILSAYQLHDHFCFAGDVGYAEAMNAQVDCDYLLLIVDTGETSDGVIPGKLFEYVAAQRPIFALCDPGATQQIIDHARLGTVVDTEDVDACERRLRELLSRPVPREIQRDEEYLAQFDRRQITARLALLFDETTVASSGSKSSTS